MPGRPAVARLPRGLMVYFAPRGPSDREAVDFDRFSVIPGARRMRRQKRKGMVQPPRAPAVIRSSVSSASSNVFTAPNFSVSKVFGFDLIAPVP